MVDGCTNRFNMIVVEERVFDRYESSHALSLFDMSLKYADIVTVDEVITSVRNVSKGSAHASS